MVEVVVWQMAMDEKTRTPVVVLREKDGNGKLPIWIGATEAGAIAMRLHGKDFARPMTHDLLMTAVGACGGEVRRVEIAALKESTYFAKIVLQREEGLVVIDARPSDSIALAVRAEASIYAAKELLSYNLDEALPDSFGEGGEDDVPATQEQKASELRRRIEDMKPEDFGRYSF